MDRFRIGKLKKYLDYIGELGYICLYNNSNKFLCEGIIKDLRTVPLWRLIDEENTDVDCSYFGESENGEEAIIIHLYPFN